jgi:hypothetical protein
MRFDRLPQKDPRTIARDIPGIFSIIFPQLAPGLVAYFNKTGTQFQDIEPMPRNVVEGSTIDRAMLFEISFARAEEIVSGSADPDWEKCIDVALERQMRFFDAERPTSIEKEDFAVAEWVGNNLAKMLYEIHAVTPVEKIIVSPKVLGYQWISEGYGDFSIGPKLIEVKCTNSRFRAADYRQILMYWLLSFAAAIEDKGDEWTSCILLNPRINLAVEVSFDELISIAAAGRSKVEILELFSAIIGDYATKSLPEYLI